MDIFIAVLLTACITTGVVGPLSHAIGYNKGLKSSLWKSIDDHNKRMGL